MMFVETAAIAHGKAVAAAAHSSVTTVHSRDAAAAAHEKAVTAAAHCKAAAAALDDFFCSRICYYCCSVRQPFEPEVLPPAPELDLLTRNKLRCRWGMRRWKRWSGSRARGAGGGEAGRGDGVGGGGSRAREGERGGIGCDPLSGPIRQRRCERRFQGWSPKEEGEVTEGEGEGTVENVVVVAANA